MKSNAELDFEISAEDMEILKNFEKIKSYGQGKHDKNPIKTAGLSIGLSSIKLNMIFAKGVAGRAFFLAKMLVWYECRANTLCASVKWKMGMNITMHRNVTQKGQVLFCV